MKKVICAAVAASFVASSSLAGGLSDAIVEAVPAPVAVEQSSVPAWVIPLAIVTILVGVAVASGDDEEPRAGLQPGPGLVDGNLCDPEPCFEVVPPT